MLPADCAGAPGAAENREKHIAINASGSPTPPDGLMGVIVVNFGSHELLAANLGSIHPDGARFKIVVVDNFSTTEETGVVRGLADRHGWHLVAKNDNAGFGVGANAGAVCAAALGCEVYLFLNPDAVVTESALEGLRRTALKSPDALISPTLVDSAAQVVFQGAGMSLRTGRLGRLGITDEPNENWLTGACLAVGRTFFEQLGGFDESYFLYWEDVDLSHRALARGGRLIVLDDIRVLHNEGGTQGIRRGRAKSDAYYYYNCRNRLLFAARNLPRRALMTWLLHTPSESWQILMRGGRRQLLYSPGPLLSAASGMAIGLGSAIRALVRGADPGRVLADSCCTGGITGSAMSERRGD